MFGLFKKPMPLRTVVADMVDMLSRIRATVDELARAEAIDRATDYEPEASAFIYILGWHAIQISDLSPTDRHRFAAELTGAFANKMGSGDEALQMLKLLQERISSYNYALNHGKGRDWAAKLVFQFIHYLGADSAEHVGVQAALYVLAPQHISALRDFLSDLNKTYKFV